MANRWGNNCNSDIGFYFGLQNHSRQWLQPWNLKSLLLGRKVDRPRQHIKKLRYNIVDKVCLVKAMVFPVVMCECEIWTIKKAEHWRIDAFELCCWKRLLRVPWSAKRSNQSILSNKSTDKQEEPHQTKNLLHGKRKHQQNKKAILKWKKYIYKPYIL